jgi:hypothetical protein
MSAFFIDRAPSGGPQTTHRLGRMAEWERREGADGDTERIAKTFFN